MRIHAQALIMSRRSWKNYTPQLFNMNLTENLLKISRNFDTLNVQEQWNELEHLLITSADQSAPMTDVVTDRVAKPCYADHVIKPKINRRNRLLRLDRLGAAGAHAHADEIRNLNKEIQTHFTGIRRDKVRRLATASKGNIFLCLND